MRSKTMHDTVCQGQVTLCMLTEQDLHDVRVKGIHPEAAYRGKRGREKNNAENRAVQPEHE
eukprot:4635091-Pleurochrysis_carterae.AAC.2